MFLFSCTLFEFTLVDLRPGWPTGTFGVAEKNTKNYLTSLSVFKNGHKYAGLEF